MWGVCLTIWLSTMILKGCASAWRLLAWLKAAKYGYTSYLSVRSNDNLQDNTIKLSEACELYLRLKGVGEDKMFTGTANRNTDYLTKLLGDRPMLSETTWALPKSAVIFKRTSLSLELVRFASTLTGGSTFWRSSDIIIFLLILPTRVKFDPALKRLIKCSVF